MSLFELMTTESDLDALSSEELETMERHPGDRVVIVGSDGSTLVSSRASSWDDLQAYAGGERS